MVELTGDYNSFTVHVPLLCNTNIFQRACMYDHHIYIAEYGSTADEVANPARGQLNRENEYFPVCPPFAPKNLVLRDAFDRPVPRQRAQSPNSG